MDPLQLHQSHQYNHPKRKHFQKNNLGYLLSSIEHWVGRKEHYFRNAYN